MAARGHDQPTLALDQIQGNVLPGFGTDVQTLLALRVAQPAAARQWLASLVEEHEVTTAEQVDKSRKAGRRDGPWLNLGLSYAGLSRLTSNAYSFHDEAFREGLVARSRLLGDPSDPDDPGHTSHWVVGGPATHADLLVIVAGADQAKVEAKAAECSQDAAPGLVPVWQETGNRLGQEDYGFGGGGRPGQRSIEHFGFRDGISQPAVRGLRASAGTQVEAPKGSSPDGPEFAAPGTPLLWPGSFVFGYPRQDPIDARAPGLEMLEGPSWTRNGSFLVFRRLRQDVVRFARFLERAAREHGSGRWDAEALGALLVGRWRSGAPVALTSFEAGAGYAPGKDSEALAGDRQVNNFDYTSVLPDPLGLGCPNSAHVRKANPRAGYTEQGGLEDTLTRRILRRGIPYGPRLQDPLHANQQDARVDRGLHFLCYQTSIVEQFEFLMRNWFNSPSAPRGDGVDLILGQTGQARRACFLPVPDGRPVAVETTDRFVIPTGGGYFFAPSIDGLEELASGGP